MSLEGLSEVPNYAAEEAEAERVEARGAVFDAASNLGLLGDDDEELTPEAMGRICSRLAGYSGARKTPELVALETSWTRLLRLGDSTAWEAVEATS